MIVRHLDAESGTARHVVSPASQSTRLLLAEDGMGFSLNVTEIEAGLEIRMRYLHHFEAVYCIAGTGSIEDEATGVRHEIKPGTIYALEQHDAHVLRSETKLELICVFNPALVGTEVRDPDTGYPPPE
ncbi:MAG: ectoine synthase [Rickettsiales bacterium]